MQLLIELLISTMMVGVTVLIHLGGIALLLIVVRKHRQQSPDHRSMRHEAIATVGAAGGLFVLHIVEIWLYAGLYLLIGAITRLEAALYFSVSSYTTVGYGDFVLSEDWRLLGAIESANGIILLGWSTAFFVSIVGRIRWIEAEVREFD